MINDGKQIGIVGASGLIGRAVVERLLLRGWNVKSFGRREENIPLDLDDQNSIAAASFQDLSIFVHCAGATDESFASDPVAAFLRCTIGMQVLITRAADAGVKCIIYISTAHVYGNLAGTVSESTPANPLSNYAIGHYAAERVLTRVCIEKGISGLILRPNAVYGIPDLTSFNRWGLIPFAFPRAALEHGEIVLKTHGMQRRNFVGAPTIGEIIADFCASPMNTASNITIRNPIGHTELSVVEFARHVAAIAEKETGRTIRVVAPTPDHPVMENHYISDNTPMPPEPLDLDTHSRLLMACIASKGH